MGRVVGGRRASYQAGAYWCVTRSAARRRRPRSSTISRSSKWLNPKFARSIIDTHRHVWGPKLRQKLVDNGGLDDSKPLPQVTDSEQFYYRESVDADYSMEIQRQSGVSRSVISYGGEVEGFGQHIIRANTVDTLTFLNDEALELRDRFPDDIACMANAHALEEKTRV